MLGDSAPCSATALVYNFLRLKIIERIERIEGYEAIRMAPYPQPRPPIENH